MLYFKWARNYNVEKHRFNFVAESGADHSRIWSHATQKLMYRASFCSRSPRSCNMSKEAYWKNIKLVSKSKGDTKYSLSPSGEKVSPPVPHQFAPMIKKWMITEFYLPTHLSSPGATTIVTLVVAHWAANWKVLDLIPITIQDRGLRMDRGMREFNNTFKQASA